MSAALAAPLHRAHRVSRHAAGDVHGYEARVVDGAMNEVPRGTMGRLAVRGPTGCRYLADDRQSLYVRDGWNLTGDSFVQDADGVPPDDATQQRLQNHVKATIAPYKYPRSVKFLDALPKTQTGKIQRFRLRGE
jgi:2-aminobenzoate-CoA ligase